MRILALFDGLVSFTTKQETVQVSATTYLTNTFCQLAQIRAKPGLKRHELLRQLMAHAEFTAMVPLAPKMPTTYRLMYNKHGTLAKLYRDEHAMLEGVISRHTGAHANPEAKNCEYWLMERSEGYLLLGYRLSFHSDYGKVLPPGTLRPEVAGLLIELSEPKETDIILDPFAGSGSLLIARAAKPYAQLMGSDFNEASVIAMQKTLAHEKNVLVFKANSLTNFPIASGSVTTIITDPPWGHFQKLPTTPERFYSEILAEFYRVLQPGGVVALLFGERELMQSLLSDFTKEFEIVTSSTILISGHKASLFVLKKLV